MYYPQMFILSNMERLLIDISLFPSEKDITVEGPLLVG